MTDDSLARLEQSAAVGAIAHLPVWESVRAEDVEPGVRQLLAETEREFTALEAAVPAGGNPGWRTLMDPLERLHTRLGRVMARVGHLLAVKYSDALQAAYDAVRADYVALSNRMAQSKAVYDGMVALRDGPEWSTMSQARKRILTESIRGMERSGVHLEGEPKRRYLEIQDRLAKLSNDFQTNLVKEEQGARIEVTDPARVSGVPAAILDLALATARDDGVADAAGEGPWHFVVNGVNYQAIVQHAEDRSLREEMYRAYAARGTSAGHDNRPLLEEILKLRQEQAHLLGFASYAEFSVDAKMAASPEAVWHLLSELEAAARPVAEREYAALVEFMRAHGAPEAADPRPWDVPYHSERLREERYGYDAELLRDYFQLPKVLDGLFTLVHRLYGMEIRRCPSDAVPVWDDAVEFFEVLRDGEVVAAFFVDPCARPGEKRGGAWMATVVNRSRLLATGGRTSSLPVALFVMNARPPSGSRPALMSLDEVRTLFHEFGHATQHMFTEIEEGGASGMNLVEWDAVELASQFNEYWMEHKPFLRDLTAHVETGEPLDEDTLDRIVASKNFMIGNGTLRQLQFAKTDMALHEKYGIAADGRSPFDVEREIARQTLVTPLLEGATQLPAFGHLFSGGYAAGYYSYKWAEVLAADAFAAFREAGLDDARAVSEVATRFRETVLGLGGSLPAAEVYRLFRGRDATPDALLADQGLR